MVYKLYFKVYLYVQYSVPWISESYKPLFYFFRQMAVDWSESLYTEWNSDNLCLKLTSLQENQE